MNLLTPVLLSWRSALRRLLLPLALILFSLQLTSVPAYATGVADIPQLSAGDPTWVVDEADLLSRINIAKISDRLADLAEQTGNEVRIVTIHRLDYGETPDSLTKKIFDKWYPTLSERSNQVLLFIDDVTNGVAIKTGEGISSLMPEDIAASVAQETVMVPLRDGNRYNQAFLDATDRLFAVLSGEEDPGPPIVEDTLNVEGTFTRAEDTDDYTATIVVVVLLVVATIVPMATYFWYAR